MLLKGLQKLTLLDYPSDVLAALALSSVISLIGYVLI